MKNVIYLCATALAFASPGLAHAADSFGPTNGTYVFQGPVTVQKNLSPATSCTLEVSVAVTGVGTPSNAASVTAAALSGGPICNVITFSNLNYTVDARGAGGTAGTAGAPAEELWISTPRVNIPPLLLGLIPADACEGVLKTYWIGNGPPTPREIEFDSPFSDITDANPDNPGATENPCKIIGTLTQISGPSGANLDITT